MSAQLAEDLRAAFANIDAPQKWCKGPLAKDVEGAVSSITSRLSVSFCMLGAVWRIGLPFLRERAVMAALKPEIGYRTLPSSNDDPSTTHADVVGVFQRAIAAAEARA